MASLDFNADIGAMRSLLNQADPDAWFQLCGHLDRYFARWPAARLEEQLLPYILHNLSGWDDTFERYAPYMWVHRAMEGDSPPQLMLATALHFVGQEKREARIVRLLECEYLMRIRYIDFTGVSCTDRILDTLIAARQLGLLGDLQSIDISDAGGHRQAFKLLKAAPCLRGVDIERA